MCFVKLKLRIFYFNSSSLLLLLLVVVVVVVETTVAQWLRCYATNWKVAGSIPVGVGGILH